MADQPSLPPLAENLCASAGRAALQAVAGLLVAQGVLQTGKSDEFVTIGAGILVSVAGLLWSYLHNKAGQRTLAAAAAAPPPDLVTQILAAVASPIAEPADERPPPPPPAAQPAPDAPAAAVEVAVAEEAAPAVVAAAAEA